MFKKRNININFSVIFSKALREEGARIIDALTQKSTQKQKVVWNIHSKNKSEITGNDIINEIKRSRILILLQGNDYVKGLDFIYVIKIKDLLIKHRCNLIIINFNDSPFQYGFPRDATTIKFYRKDGAIKEDSIIQLLNAVDIVLRSSKVTFTTTRIQLQQLLNRETMSKVTNSIYAFIKLFSSNKSEYQNYCLLYTAVYLLEWVEYISSLNSDRVRSLTLEHNKKVLEYLFEICNLNKPLEDKYPLKTDDDYFIALFGALFHNQCLQRKLPDLEETEYIYNAPRFFYRNNYLYEMVTESIPAESIALDLVQKVFFVGIEMYKDSYYWHEASLNDQAIAKIHNKHYDKYKKCNNNITDIGVALRICDTLDVGHRCVPDLIRDLFKAAGYRKGIECFFRVTFANNKYFLFPKEPKLSNRQLTIYWPVKSSVNSLNVYLVIQKIIYEKVKAILERLKNEGNHPNLAVDILSVYQGSLSLLVRRDIVWSFFPLVIEYPSSDSVSAHDTISIIPELLDYICDAGKRLQWDQQQTAYRIKDLLDVIGRLRRNCHFLPCISEVANEAVKVSKTLEYNKKEVIAALKDVLPYKSSGRTFFTKLENRNSTNSRSFFVYGLSQPVTEWLVSLAETLPYDEKISVTFLLCRRKLLVPDSFLLGSSIEKNLNILNIDEHEEAIKLLKKVRKGLSKKIEISDNIWDFEKLPMMEDSRYKPEILFGARRFLVENNNIYIISNYGADLLSLAASALGMNVRVVTGKDRFDHSTTEYKLPKSKSAFAISYSHVENIVAEDEKVPINQITFVTTENTTYLSDKAKEKLLIKHNSNIIKGKYIKNDKVHFITGKVRKPRSIQSEQKINRRVIVLLTANQAEKDAAIKLAGIQNALAERTDSDEGYQYIDIGLRGCPFRILLYNCTPGSSSPGSSQDHACHAIKKHNPYAIIVSGIAAGIDESLAIGEILISKQVFFIEPQKIQNTKTIFRGPTIPATNNLFNWFRSAGTNWRYDNRSKKCPKIVQCIIATGEKVIDSKKYVNIIKDRESGAKGIEMEAGGVINAIGESRVKWIVVKSISDRGYLKSDDYQQIAANNAFDFIYYTLTFEGIMNDMRAEAKKN